MRLLSCRHGAVSGTNQTGGDPPWAPHAILNAAIYKQEMAMTLGTSALFLASECSDMGDLSSTHPLPDNRVPLLGRLSHLCLMTSRGSHTLRPARWL